MSTSNTQSKEEFMTACLKDHTQEECDRMWNEAKAGDKDPSYAQLAKDNKMKDLEIERLKHQLRQAIDIFQKVKDNEKAQEEAEKERLVRSITDDGIYERSFLADKTSDELKTIRQTINDTLGRNKDFASVTAADAASKSRKPQLTVGVWDSEKKQWVGGI